MSESGTDRARRAAAVAAVLRHPVLVMLLGAGLFLCGFVELLEEFDPTFDSWIGAHHGVMLFGAVTAVKGLVEAVEGMEKVSSHVAKSAKNHQ